VETEGSEAKTEIFTSQLEVSLNAAREFGK